jgi:hypothetical protein
MGKKSRRNKAPRARRDKEEPAREWDLKWAEPPEPVVMGRLAHRWEGVGPIPTQLVPLLLSETWNDPAVLPSLQARRRIGESCATPEKFDRLMKGSFTPVRDGWTRAWTDVVSDAGRPDLGKHF